jgi:phosphoribosylaminoimidazolecarboxamide formyltransferase/IMP cyclohydrolase
MKQGRLLVRGLNPLTKRRNCRLGLGDVTGLWSFGPVYDFELDGLSLFQGPEAGPLNSGVVDEDVAAALALDEPITLGVVEPLDLACDTHRFSSLLTCGASTANSKKKTATVRPSVDGAILASAAEIIITCDASVNPWEFHIMPRALLSVSDKTGLLPFARTLAALRFELVSTGGTARSLEEAGVPVQNISAVTGFPEIMDGRVKTLHPSVHAAILARRSRTDDMATLQQHHITPIDLVVVNLYPFVKAAGKADVAFSALLEEIDVGGPTMVRSAAKNFQDVVVVVDPADYDRVLSELERPGGPSLEFRFDLARKAFAHTAAYDAAISATLAQFRPGSKGSSAFTRSNGPAVIPSELRLSLARIKELRYGENPHQRAAWYSVDTGTGLGATKVLQGKELSFTNLLDLDAAARIAMEFTEPAAAVIKHTNPSGVAIGVTIDQAYVRARDADSLAAFGGIIGLNRAIDVATAQALVSTFIEAVIAPGVVEEALTVLGAKSNLRVVVADLRSGDDPASRRDIRSILGAMLVQERDAVVEARSAWDARMAESAGLKVVTRRAPTDFEWGALRFAWRICAHVKSNAVIFSDTSRTLAIGAGQMSRVDAVQVAVMKAMNSGGNPLSGSVAASDAFFPFRDGLDAIARAGATAVVQPGGSLRDSEVIAAADEHGIAMVLTGRRHFRH